MPTTNLRYNEDDISALIANDVRERHKLKKDHEVKTLVVVDRDDDGENPVVSVEVAFNQEVEAKGGKGKK